jgi:hypothetical protein
LDKGLQVISREIFIKQEAEMVKGNTKQILSAGNTASKTVSNSEAKKNRHAKKMEKKELNTQRRLKAGIVGFKELKRFLNSHEVKPGNFTRLFDLLQKEHLIKIQNKTKRKAAERTPFEALQKNIK